MGQKKEIETERRLRTEQECGPGLQRVGTIAPTLTRPCQRPHHLHSTHPDCAARRRVRGRQLGGTSAVPPLRLCRYRCRLRSTHRGCTVHHRAVDPLLAGNIALPHARPWPRRCRWRSTRRGCTARLHHRCQLRGGT